MAAVREWALVGGWWISPGQDPVQATDPDESSSAEPTAQTTGPAPGVTLTLHEGDYVATAGASALHITGNLYLAASDIEVSDCRIDGSVFFSTTANKSYAIPTLSGQTLTRVWARGAWCTGTAGMTMQSCRIGPSTDTDMQLSAYQPSAPNPYLNAENITLKDSYFHPPLASTGERHLQAVHLMGCHNVLVENCSFDYVVPDHATQVQTTASFFVQSYPKECQNVTLKNCAFYGGGYYQIGIDSTPDMTVQDCRFHSFVNTDGNNGTVQYPPKPDAHAVTASGNTLDGSPYTWTQPSGA
jgi:hypothetical protein